MDSIAARVQTAVSQHLSSMESDLEDGFYCFAEEIFKACEEIALSRAAAYDSAFWKAACESVAEDIVEFKRRLLSMG